MEAVASTAYKKIAMLVDFVESHVSAGDVTSLLRAIELFGAGIGQWLKVAADCKAQLVEASMLRRASWISDACVELGTFVGYTAIRLARWVAGWGPKAASAGVPGRSVSLEVDAIHTLVEDLGARSVGLSFMDHRGTRFHSDLFRLQSVDVVPPGATHVCDNTLKPGAPLCLWLTAYEPGSSRRRTGP